MARRSRVPFTGLIAVAVVVAFALSVLSPVARAQQQPAAAGSAPTPGPAPRLDLSGMWTPADGPGAAIQAGGVAAVPNDGKPEHALPYTPHGLELYKSHKALGGTIQFRSHPKWNITEMVCEDNVNFDEFLKNEAKPQK